MAEVVEANGGKAGSLNDWCERSIDNRVLAEERDLEARRPEKLVLRVDRTDPSKNIVRGLEAFGLLLDTRPEWRGRARMLALLDPSRQSIPEYVEYVAAIERTTEEINARHPHAIDLQVADNFQRSIAAY